jgi:hypothetical protein
MRTLGLVSQGKRAWKRKPRECGRRGRARVLLGSEAGVRARFRVWRRRGWPFSIVSLARVCELVSRRCGQARFRASLMAMWMPLRPGPRAACGEALRQRAAGARATSLPNKSDGADDGIFLDFDDAGALMTWMRIIPVSSPAASEPREPIAAQSDGPACFCSSVADSPTTACADHALLWLGWLYTSYGWSWLSAARMPHPPASEPPQKALRVSVSVLHARAHVQLCLVCLSSPLAP